jgi:hypothetical protein
MVIIRQFPPRIAPQPPTEPPNAQNGGRVQSIAVNPTNDDHIIVANEFGGLWKTTNRGLNWNHLDGFLPIFAKDVQYAPDGNTVVATAARDNCLGGGIWISRDGGNNWSRPLTGDPHNDPNLPNLSRIPDMISAYGICYSPDDQDTVFVGTDYGVAVTTNNGDTWDHKMLNDTEPIWTDYNIAEPKMQNSVTSILALPNYTIIALCGMRIYRTDDRFSTNWRWRDLSQNLSLPGNFAFQWNYGCKKIDVSPFDTDKVFILQDYSLLLLYEVSLDQFHEIPLPGGGQRGPFVRVARSSNGTSFDLWVGAGEDLLKATSSDVNSARNLRTTDWIRMRWGHGIHPDSAYLALDRNKRPLLYGSDGGLFKPTNEEATNWRGIDTGVTGTNSFQISDLAGTNVRLRSGVTYSTSLYFTTQDNDIWASPDDGHTWPNHDSPEGCHLQVRQDASEGEDVQVSYVRITGREDPITHMPLVEENRRFSGANLANPIPIPNTDINGMALTGFSEPFFVSPNNWVRYRLNAGQTEIYISTNNGSNWRKRAEVSLAEIGVPTISGDFANPVIYFPFRSSITTPNQREIIFLSKIENLFNLNINKPRITSIYLPNYGSLGIRATMFDSHVVFGVDPQNPDHIILPDIYHHLVIVSEDGGTTWREDINLTSEVTKNGTVLLYGGDNYRMQVTKISFDPYNRNRILVGTRDLGIIFSEDGGGTWSTLPGSEVLSYITNFFFKHSNIARASSYGRGLWRIDFNSYAESVPFDFICKGDCTFRFPDKEDTWKDAPFDNPDDPFWIDKDVSIFFNGQVNGLVLSGLEIKLMTVTPETTFKRFIRRSDDYEELDVIESDKGEGFDQLIGCLAALNNGEIIKGIIQKENKIVGIISGKEKFKQPEKKSKQTGKQYKLVGDSAGMHSKSESAEPYLFVSTSIPIAGEPVLGGDKIVHLFGRGFMTHDQDSYTTILVDGKTIEENLKISEDGSIESELKIPDILSIGKHSIKIVQKVQENDFSASASFVKAIIEDFEEKDRK